MNQLIQSNFGSSANSCPQEPVKPRATGSCIGLTTRQIADRCVADATEGKCVNAPVSKSYDCKGEDGSEGKFLKAAHYRICKLHGKIVLSHSITIDGIQTVIDWRTKNIARVSPELRTFLSEEISDVKSVYARMGIDYRLHVTYLKNPFYDDEHRPLDYVRLSSNHCRSDKGLWCLFRSDPKHLLDNVGHQYQIMHELAHHLGLVDEYRWGDHACGLNAHRPDEVPCSAPAVSSCCNVMRGCYDENIKSLDHLELAADAFYELVKPICPLTCQDIPFVLH